LHWIATSKDRTAEDRIGNSQSAGRRGGLVPEIGGAIQAHDPVEIGPQLIAVEIIWDMIQFCSQRSASWADDAWGRPGSIDLYGFSGAANTEHRWYRHRRGFGRTLKRTCRGRLAHVRFEGFI
jgi:hypothetical protein